MTLLTARGIGLIVNDLVVNAVKHAFPSGREGVIQVACGLDADRSIVAQVSDNGTGPALTNQACPASGLGKKIVEMLLAQLDGALETTTTGRENLHKVIPPRG